MCYSENMKFATARPTQLNGIGLEHRALVGGSEGWKPVDQPGYEGQNTFKAV